MIKDWNREDLQGQVFHFKNSLRPFIAIRDCARDYFFLDLNEGIFYSFDDLEFEGLCFYEKEDDDDFKGVEIAGKVEWVG